MLSLIFRRGSGGCWEEKYWDAKGVWGAVFSPWQLRLLGFIIAWKSEPTLVYPDCSVLLTQLPWGHWINSMILLGMWVWDLEKFRERELGVGLMSPLQVGKICLRGEWGVRRWVISDTLRRPYPGFPWASAGEFGRKLCFSCLNLATKELFPSMSLGGPNPQKCCIFC